MDAGRPTEIVPCNAPCRRMQAHDVLQVVLMEGVEASE